MVDRSNIKWVVKRTMVSIFVIFPIFLIFQSCKDKKETKEHIHTADSTKMETLYYCPMDTQIVQNKPGTCPICGMDLELKPTAHHHSLMDHKEWVYTPANVAVLSSVKSVKPIEKSVPVRIKATGYITYDERRINSVAAKIGGRIEKLYVKYNFQPIKKGQALYEVYSHDLQTAQQEYLYVKKNDPGSIGLVNAAKRKLLLLGMTEEQVDQLGAGDHVHATTTVYSPYSGFVIEKQKKSESYTSGGSMEGNSGMAPSGPVESKEITLREGSYVDKGTSVFFVANTDVVWGVFEVYSNQLTQLKKNQVIHIVPENTGEMIMGKVDFIEPGYKEEAGTVRFRVYLTNEEQELKIGNILAGEVEAGEKKGWWVPTSAVYDLGEGKIVFVKRNGAFETRKVTVGYTSENEIEIVGGLTPEEEIAANAQFLIDSESFVKMGRD